jgi:hypothetical protein
MTGAAARAQRSMCQLDAVMPQALHVKHTWMLQQGRWQVLLCLPAACIT